MHRTRRVRSRQARGQAYDVVTPTAAERARADLRSRRRHYGVLMSSCLVLVVFGFFVPAPVPVRLAALAVGSVLPPLAAISGNGGPRG